MSVSLEKYADKYFGEYLKDESINEICYNGKDKIWLLGTNGIWQEKDTNLDFDSASAIAQASAAFKETQIDKSRPILSCELVTGERVQIILPPATKRGHISITIRKPSRTHIGMDYYEKSGIFDEIRPANEEALISPNDKKLLELYKQESWAEFFKAAVTYGKNIVICGETGSGKTTYMKALMDYIPKHERIVTIEDVEEIVFIHHKNFVQLFYPSEAKRTDILNSATLLKSCLRMKPDRILLAELRGAETYDFVNILSSGHGGSITSCHAGSSKQCFDRLAMMILQNPEGQCLPYEIIKQMLYGVIDIIMHLYAHMENGKYTRSISEVYYKGAVNER